MTFEKALAELKNGKRIRLMKSDMVFFMPRGSNQVYVKTISENSNIVFEVNYFSTKQLLDETWEVYK